MRTQLLITGAAMLAATTLASCGDDDTPALTKAEFIEQADAVCLAADVEAAPTFDAFWTSLGDVDSDTEAGQQSIFDGMDDVIEVVAPIWHDMADDIESLGVPEGDEERIADLVDDLRDAVDEMDRLVNAAVAGDELARIQLDDTDPMAGVNSRARNYGFLVCGQDG
ncbi:MAG: hypothetical protein DHS20C19_01780 [Acidimicrobiales bacterium]|nr:MAG: hypothetical protein DHS20C19_01780 [Acidimicrobiales bacterium]